jgi:hypothetical protein
MLPRKCRLSPAGASIHPAARRPPGSVEGRRKHTQRQMSEMHSCRAVHFLAVQASAARAGGIKTVVLVCLVVSARPAHHAGKMEGDDQPADT